MLIRCCLEAGNAQVGGVNKIYVNADEYSGQYDKKDIIECYDPVREVAEKSADFGHGGSDYYIMFHLIQRAKSPKAFMKS